MIRIVQGDITCLKVDAIVNAANQVMLGGGGVDGAIHRAAGAGLFDACLKTLEVRPGVRCPTGEARITPGFKLPAKFVIHTVGPVYRDGLHGEPEKLAQCYRNSLELAAQNGCKSIAFPCISTGAYGYPPRDAAGIAVREVHKFLKTHGGIEAVFCCFSSRDKSIYEELAIRQKPWTPQRTDKSPATGGMCRKSPGATTTKSGACLYATTDANSSIS